MIMSPYATSVTKQHVQGKRLADCVPDMTNRRSKAALKLAYQLRKGGKAQQIVEPEAEQLPIAA